MTPLDAVHSTALLWPSVMANVAICVGYLFVSYTIFFTRYRFLFLKLLTRISGAVFFLTCGTHHLMNAWTLVYAPHQDFHISMLHPHMLIVDWVQAFAIWVFALSAGGELWDIARLRGRTLNGKSSAPPK